MRISLAALLFVPCLAAAAVCTGTDSGVYRPDIPVVGIEAPHNARNVAAPKATWTRIGGIVSVTGMAQFVPIADGMVQFFLPLPIPTAHADSFGLSGSVTAAPIARTVTVGGLFGSDGFVNFRTEATAADVGFGMVIQYVYSYPISECFP